MQRPVSFRGHSGQTYVFRVAGEPEEWLQAPGVTLFAAPNGCTWRVIRMLSMRGREDDVQPIWAQHDAARYGGDTVLTLFEPDPRVRNAILADLEAGLSPLWPSALAENDDERAMPLAA